MSSLGTICTLGACTRTQEEDGGEEEEGGEDGEGEDAAEEADDLELAFQ